MALPGTPIIAAAGRRSRPQTGRRYRGIVDVEDRSPKRVADAWDRRVGETFDTDRVLGLLEVSGAALDTQSQEGSVLALPGLGTNRYPAWQFHAEGARSSVRPVARRILMAFAEVAADVSPFTIAAWATSPQPELDDRTPADWIADDRDEDLVVLAAKRAAHLEAR